MTSATASLDVRAVAYRYGRTPVLHGVSFTLTQGVVGLLGPNGSGKSTLMSILATVRSAETGQVRMSGIDIGTANGRQQARRLIGLLPQRYSLVGAMKVLDTVAYGAWCHGLSQRAAYPAAEQALARVEMSSHAARRVRQLSGGQRQRVAIASAIAHEPQILLLDEPTAGLDPAVRVVFRELIASLGEQACVLLATHLVEDVERTCDRVLVLHEGHLAFDGPLDTLVTASSSPQRSGLEEGYLRALGTP